MYFSAALASRRRTRRTSWPELSAMPSGGCFVMRALLNPVPVTPRTLLNGAPLR
jgi:hypothetical protein